MANLINQLNKDLEIYHGLIINIHIKATLKIINPKEKEYFDGLVDNNTMDSGKTD